MNHFQKPQDGELWQAADFALGALTGQELDNAQHRVFNDPVFRESVEDWQDLLVHNAGTSEQMMPRPSLWYEIEAEFEREVSVSSGVKPSGSMDFWKPASVLLATLCAILFAMLMYVTDWEVRPVSIYKDRIVELEAEIKTLKEAKGSAGAADGSGAIAAPESTAEDQSESAEQN